ncbi:type II secretion system protein N [Endozoicomonas numazuensis]|uniref:Type II secretion system protein GspC N-terminal domain-containing protein n=1 Tax=Endozoicomonas numazuensis TaxID=1137799 RepID=A0A081NHZ2_9GAMM|nr:type II secretion system protein N [Endozoicomonas numazuensis]KEQ18065.1 hypothetical protein GZ78_10825 [Endozoicomonas numazuensis]
MMSLAITQNTGWRIKPVWLFPVILLSGLLASLAYQLHADWVLVNHDADWVVPVALVSDELTLDESLPLAELDTQFFGVYQSPEALEVVQVLPGVTPVTTFSYTLEAIYFSTQRNLSAISISSGQGNDLFREADELASGVIIKRIDQDKVILSRNGQLEQLLLNPDQYQPVLDKPVILRPGQPKQNAQTKTVGDAENDLQTRLKQLRERLKKTTG